MCIRDRGKDVFAVPGSIFSAYSQGVLHLLRQGALPAANAQDILSQYAYRFVGKRTFTRQPAAEKLSAALGSAGSDSFEREGSAEKDVYKRQG